MPRGLLIYAFAFWASQAGAASFAVGTFTKSTAASPASQTVLHTLGEPPKVLLLWTSGAAVDGLSPGIFFGVGLSDGVTERSLSSTAITSNKTLSRHRVAASAFSLMRGLALVAQANVVAWNAAGFTLGWTTNDLNPTLIHYLAIGGAEVSAGVQGWTTPGALVDQAITGVAFRPETVLYLNGGRQTGPLPALFINIAFGFGAVDSFGHQWAAGVYSASNGQSSATRRIQNASTACLAACEVLTSINPSIEASFISLNPDGFTHHFNATDTYLDQAASLTLAGVDVQVGSFLKPVGGAPVSQRVSGLGFRPGAILFATAQNVPQVGSATHLRFGLGATDGTVQTALALEDTDSISKGNPQSVEQGGRSLIKVDDSTGAVQAEAVLAGTDPDGFTLNWTTNDPVGTEILFWALGSRTDGGVDAGSPDGGADGGADGGSSDAGNSDAGSSDAGSSDAGGNDGGSDDAGSSDAGNSDAGSSDAGGNDAGSSDAGSSDSGATDASTSDSGTPDAGSADGGTTPRYTVGCDCTTSTGYQHLWALSLLLILLHRNRAGKNR